MHSHYVPFPRPAPSAGVPLLRGLATMEKEGWLCGHLEARTGWAGGQPLSSQMLGLQLGPGSPSFKARGSLWGLSPWLLLGPHHLLPDGCPHIARGGGGLQAGAAISGSLSGDGCRVGGRAVTHWCCLPSPPPPALPTPQTLLQVSGHPLWGGGVEGGRPGGAAALPPCTLQHQGHLCSLRAPQASVGTSLRAWRLALARA